MDINRSLAISNKILDLQMSNIIGLLKDSFPRVVLEEDDLDFGVVKRKSRDRVFTDNNTLLTMVLTAVQQDKTLANSVGLFYVIHQKELELSRECCASESARLRDCEPPVRKAGRPKNYQFKPSKSLCKDISLNTAAYSKARTRLPMRMAEELFSKSLLSAARNSYSHWHGYRVYLGDGTYLQMQDTPSLREKYQVNKKGSADEGYPQGLLEVIIERGTGQVFSYRMSSRHTSELPLFYGMMDSLPPKSVVLLDDLYNCYEIICKARRLGVEMVVAAKRERNYVLVETLAPGDEIIKIKQPKNRSKWLDINEKAGEIVLRRICCQSPDGTEYCLLTTILDRSISKEDFQLLYLTRWDVEIGIREVKTIMHINVLRSKTPEMALKELAVSLAAYNLIRKIIYASLKDLPFPPKEGLIHQFHTNNKDILIDKKGRIYKRWSTGRARTQGINNKASPV